jgi:hypothetical protein
MNNRKLLHAPDIEDAEFMEEDYLDPTSRKEYEHDIIEKMHYGKKKNVDEDPNLAKLTPEERKQIRDQEKEDKVKEIVNYATVLL